MNKKGKYVYDWPRPMVTVDAAVFTLIKSKMHVLLIKRGHDPFQGQWAIPGGYIDMDEDLIDGAARELAEETGLSNIKLKQMQTFGKPGRDPRGRTVSTVFTGWAQQNNTNAQAGDDAAEAKWFDIENLPEMAFDHNKVLNFAIKKMQRETNTG